MPFPPLVDFLALMGIDLALSAGCLRLLAGIERAPKQGNWTKWATAFFFIGMWLPVGPAHLPLLAYVRGISSDLSITLVALACLDLCARCMALPAIAGREKTALRIALALAALFLYPAALGWGDWDSYRSGWASWGLWTALLAVSFVAWLIGLTLLPSLIALALLAWSAGLMESSNLWDYLVVPWLAAAALFGCLKSGARRLWTRQRFWPRTFLQSPH